MKLPTSTEAVSRYYLALLLVIALVISIVTVSRGAIPQTIFGADSAISFNAGWRAYCGLRPHADFYSSLGPWIYLYVATGYYLFGVSVHVIAYMNAILFCLLLGITWYLLRDRLSPFWLFCVALLIAVCFAAPFSLRYYKWLPTYVAIYNRHGCAFMLLFCALLFSPIVTKVSELRWKITSAVLGLLLPVMLFLKITLFTIAAPVLVAAYFIEVRKWLNIKWFSAMFILFSVFFLAYIRFDVVAMASDLAITARAKSQYFQAMAPHVQRTTDELIWWSLFCLGMFGLGAFSLYKKPELKFGLWELFSESVIVILMLAVCVAIVFGNALYVVVEDYPVLILLTALIAVRITQRDGIELPWSERTPYFKVMMVTSIIFVLSYVVNTTYYMVGYEARPERVSQFEMPTMRGLVFDKNFVTHTSVYVTEDGIKLLTKHGAEDKRFVVFEFTSFLHFALRTVPYKGTPFIDDRVNITRDSFPAPEKFIGNADYIMEAKPPGHSFNTVLTLKACYKDYLEKNYKVIDESQYWILLKHL
ncbi:MAG: hypothetical protein ACAI35_19335 [Candidatus Methylacidiphilales bacterium]|nr:hypothetical protein [Candidatus Methylacidiphilales bacterium]